MTRHSGEVYGHSKGKAPGQKHYYRPIYSGSRWDEFVTVHTVSSLLQVCCGGSRLGDVRVDIDPGAPGANVRADMLRLPFKDGSFTTVACDAIYRIDNRTRVHLQRELARVASHRIIFKGTWIPRATGWRVQKPVMGIFSHTCADVAVMVVLEKIPHEPDLFDALT